ncbi:hypothetical protein ACFLYS_00015 [Chloroflexota bacterium]
MSIFGQAKMYCNFARGMRRFLKETLTLEQCLEIISDGLENREQNLLHTVKKTIYENENSPFLKLLHLAGCEYGDFEKLVLADGVEASLHKLKTKGVYISLEEFKGKQAAVRGSRSLTFRESDFDNPLIEKQFETCTGGSRSHGTKVIMNFVRYHKYAAHNRATLEAHGAYGSPAVLWLPIMPSAAWLFTVMRLSKIGIPTIKWFSQVDAGRIKPQLSKRMATYYAIYAGRLSRAAFPKPEYVDLSQSSRVSTYVAEVLKEGKGCLVETYTNSAVRVCQAAVEKGLDLRGAIFGVAGEPLTETKAREIRASGAGIINMYGGTDIGLIGFGCANPLIADDVHQFTDNRAIIQHKRKVPYGDVEVDAFLFTSLSPVSAKILLNVENGDYGVIEKRDCDCYLEKLGYKYHVHSIRGFDKLTGEGMTFLGTNLLKIMEEMLPAKFGGASIDYQMVEEEDEKGHTRVSVVVSPEVGEIDENEVIRTILSELGKGKDTQRMMAEMWSQANTLRVKRIRPYTTAASKLLTLHINKDRKPKANSL